LQTTLEIIADALRERMGSDVEIDIGETALHEKMGNTRIVIVRRGGQITDILGTAGPIRVRHMGRIVQFYRTYDDVMQIEAHLTAPSGVELEVLQRRLLNAARLLFGTSSRPGSYAVRTDDDKSGKVHGGKAYAVQTFTWRVTIARERTHQLGRENASELSPKIPVTELVEINEIRTVYTLQSAAGDTPGTTLETVLTPSS
jgi:hypothetical protein